MAEDPGGWVDVCVATAPAGETPIVVHLRLPPTATIADAVAASRLHTGPVPAAGNIKFGIWGKRLPPATIVRAGDRVEIYRALAVDPKIARQQRAAKQGRKTQR